MVSIILPTRNRQASLDRVLPSYLILKECLEIIIIDDFSDTPIQISPSLASAEAPPIRLVRNPERKGQQYSRMLGVSLAQADFVQFAEDDLVPEESYCSVLLGFARRYGLDIVAGRWINVRTEEYSFKELEKLDDNVERTPEVDLPNLKITFETRGRGLYWAYLLHSGALVRKQVFEVIQFDQKYQGNAFREETDFYLSARKHNLLAAYTPEVTAYHVRSQYSSSGGHRGGLLWRELYCARNTLQLFRKHKAVLCEDYRLTRFPILNTAWYYLFPRYASAFRKYWRSSPSADRV